MVIPVFYRTRSGRLARSPLVREVYSWMGSDPHHGFVRIFYDDVGIFAYAHIDN